MRLPELGSLPPGYLLERGSRGVVAWRPEYARLLRDNGYAPDVVTATGAFTVSEKAGKRPLHELRAGGRRFLLRRFSHGGLLRGATGDRFRDPLRPFVELRLSEWLRATGVRTPQVAAARARAAEGGGWRLDLVTECVEGTTDLGYVLGLGRRGRLEGGVRRALLGAAGQFVGGLHRLGLWHADLQPNNLLVNEGAFQGEAPELWILDLDRSERFEQLPDERRHANLERLFRHVVRVGDIHGGLLSRADCLRFLRAYAADRGDWREDWRAVTRRYGRRLKWHRLGWRLERLLGLRRDDRRARPR